MLTFQKYIHFMRTQFPPGSRVLLLSNDQPKPVPDGTMGTLTEVDSAGRFLVNWDNGKRTALNMEDDHFRIFQPEPMELKLYFPISAEYYSRNQWGELVRHLHHHLYRGHAGRGRQLRPQHGLPGPLCLQERCPVHPVQWPGCGKHLPEQCVRGGRSWQAPHGKR